MNTYLLLLIISTGASLVVTPVVGRISRHFEWLDTWRDGRRLHISPVPRLGGVAVFICAMLALASLPLINNALTQSLRASNAQVFRILVPATLMFLLGAYDDLHGANARIKFAVQVLAGLLFCAMGGRIAALSVPLVGSLELHPLVGYGLTLLWTVGLSNAFNLIDGMDGLGAGAAFLAAAVMLAVSLMLGHPLVTVTSIALCGSLLGFLPYNFNPASIFLGDSGALFVGFTLSALSVQGTQKASTAVAVAIPLVAFGLPIVDTGLSIVRRLIGGRPIFDGDAEHIHHMLLARGWSQRRVALVLYGACALFGLSALFLVNDAGMKKTAVVLVVVGAVVALAVARLRYHEIEEVSASLRRSFVERRLRVANNVRVRRATRVMSRATKLDEIFVALEELLEVGHFVYANMQLGHNASSHRGNGNGHNQPKGHARPATNEINLQLCGPDAQPEPIGWSWQRDDIEPDKVIGSGRFWTLRLPLSTQEGQWGYLNLYREFGDEALLLDINYLCDLFQRETAKAVERVLVGDSSANAESRVAPLIATPLSESDERQPPLGIAPELPLLRPDAMVA